MKGGLKMGFGWTELIVIFGIILLLFGPKKLPELARNLGSSINVFKDELSKTKDQLSEEITSEPTPQTEPVQDEPEPSSSSQNPTESTESTENQE